MPSLRTCSLIAAETFIVLAFKHQLALKDNTETDYRSASDSKSYNVL